MHPDSLPRESGCICAHASRLHPCGSWSGTSTADSPSLDRYDDEQCLRFVRAARCGAMRKAVNFGLIGFFGFCGLVAGCFAAAILMDRLDRWHLIRPYPGWSVALWVLACIPLLSMAPLASFLVRDRLLRARIRFILRTRGNCPGCLYSLIGLPISAASKVVCPECGIQTEVDPALGESGDRSGRSESLPAHRLPGPPAPDFHARSSPQVQASRLHAADPARDRHSRASGAATSTGSRSRPRPPRPSVPALKGSSPTLKRPRPPVSHPPLPTRGHSSTPHRSSSTPPMSATGAKVRTSTARGMSTPTSPSSIGPIAPRRSSAIQTPRPRRSPDG